LAALRSFLLLITLLLASLSVSASEWSLNDAAGVRYTASGLHGRWVLINFWAPWCPSCIEEIPELNAAQKNTQNLQVIGVAVMYKNRREVTEMAKSQAVSYPVVFGDEDTASDFGGMQGLPTSFLYAPTGKLQGKHAGPLTRNEIEQAIEGKGSALFAR